MTRRKKHRGFNLIEAAIVLGVVGLVIGGIWVAASAVSTNYKLNRLERGILQIHNGIQNQWKNQSWPFGGGDVYLNGYVVSAGLAPQDMVCGTECLRNYLARDQINGWTSSLMVYARVGQLKIAINGMSESDCINVVMRVANGLFKAGTLQTWGLYSYITSQSYTAPYTLTTAEIACNGGEDASGFNILFVLDNPF